VGFYSLLKEKFHRVTGFRNFMASRPQLPSRARLQKLWLLCQSAALIKPESVDCVSIICLLFIYYLSVMSQPGPILKLLLVVLLVVIQFAATAPATAEPLNEPAKDAVTHQFENRDAWKLENDRLRVSILHGAGHLAEVVLKTDSGDSVNPLRVPPWPSPSRSLRS
jgi:hypothetical protein